MAFPFGYANLSEKKSGIFDLMNKKVLRTFGLTALAFVAYRAYKLYELGNAFTYRFGSMYFRRPKNLADALNSMEIVLEYIITNPTKTSMKMRGLYGDVNWKGIKVATYQAGAFTIKPGDTKISVSMFVTPMYAAQIVKDAVAKQFPVFNASLTSVFPFGITYTEKFTINTKDYLPESAMTIFK